MIFRGRALCSAGVTLLTWSSAAAAKSIVVVSALYGTPQAGKICDATAQVASMCAGRSQCAIDIENTTLCGDPDFLTVKQAEIRYTCGRSLRRTSVGEYHTATIACD